MMRSIALGAGVLAAALAGGCKKHDRGGATPVTCEVLAARTGKVTVKGVAEEAMTASQRRNAEVVGGRFSAALLKVCQDDKWSPELRACIASARPGATPAQCQDLLSPEQRDHFAQAMRRAAADGQQAALAQTVGVGMDIAGALRAIAADGPEPTCEAIAALAREADAASDVRWVVDEAAANAAVMERVCKEDAWTTEAIACSMAGDAVVLCTDKFTPAQMRRLWVEQCKLDQTKPGTTCEETFDRAAVGAPARE